MNGDGDGITLADHCKLPPPREDPDRISLEDHLTYHHHHTPQMRITSDNINDHMADSSRLLRLSPERTSIFEDRLSPERELQMSAPRLSPSRHVSPTRDSVSPEPPSESSHTPAPTALSSTPPPTIPPSSFASSTRATSTAGTSEASFEVLSGYDPISPAERHRQWQREQRRELYNNGAPTGGFRPNADLPFPITPQLLQYYPYPGQHRTGQQTQTALKEEFVNNLPGRRYSEVQYQEPSMSPPPVHRPGGGGQGMMYESRFSHNGPLQGRQNGSAVPSGLNTVHYRSSSSEVSVGGSSCSGIPSFAREFEGRNWRFGKIFPYSFFFFLLRALDTSLSRSGKMVPFIDISPPFLCLLFSPILSLFGTLT